MRVLILFFLILVGCGVKDCGVSKSIVDGRQSDDALDCMSEHLLKCDKAEVKIDTELIKGIHLEVTGMKDSKCGVKLKYGSKDSINNEVLKELSGLELRCNMDKSEFEDTDTLPTKVMATMLQMAGKGECHGSYVDAMKEK